MFTNKNFEIDRDGLKYSKIAEAALNKTNDEAGSSSEERKEYVIKVKVAKLHYLVVKLISVLDKHDCILKSLSCIKFKKNVKK